jgi:hypothetical protein
MPKICNITGDILKRVKEIWITSEDKPLCSFENILKKTPMEEILSGIPESEFLKIRVLPGDVSIDEKQKESTAGTYYTHSYSITVQPACVSNHEIIEFFTNTKVLLFLFTTSETYLAGCNGQALAFTYSESTSYFTVNLSGDTYFSALRS